MAKAKVQEKEFDLTSAIIAYEEGEADESEVIQLFQYLVDTGLAWKFQGSYGRQAMAMLDAGVIRRRERP